MNLSSATPAKPLPPVPPTPSQVWLTVQRQLELGSPGRRSLACADNLTLRQASSKLCSVGRRRDACRKRIPLPLSWKSINNLSVSFSLWCGCNPEIRSILRSDQMQPLNAKPVQIRRCRATVIVKALLRVSQVASPAKPLPLARAGGGGRRCEPLHCKEMSTARLA